MEEDLFEKLQSLVENKNLPEKYFQIILNFYLSYKKALNEHTAVEIFSTLLILIEKQFTEPYPFEIYHKKVREPFDYYKFGLDFMRPLIQFDQSKAHGLEQIEKMQSYIDNNENVILFGNHQIESDPQAISLLLERSYSKFASKIIYFAGDRVITDPIAAVFSIGCDLICIYSKKYIDIDPSLKREKQLHNKKAMLKMSELLSEGSKVIYVAPSGGRDRKNEKGQIELAPFDAQSIEMFYLMSKKAKTPTHFFPLALATYNLLPPPEGTSIEMGEKRTLNKCPIHLSFGREIDMDYYPGRKSANKLVRRKYRANHIWNIVNSDYHNLIGD